MSNRRQEIINAAIDLFYEYGYQKASLRDLSRKVGLTQAAIYYHFRNKEEILYTIIEKSSNDLYFTLKSCLSGKKDAVEELRDAILQHILSIKHGRKGAKIIIEDKSRDTFENAKFAQKICARLSFTNPILVTSAYHMKRAIMSFEKFGLKVLPFPSGFKSWQGKHYRWRAFLPGDFLTASIAIKEYLGLVFYKFAY